MAACEAQVGFVHFVLGRVIWSLYNWGAVGAANRFASEWQTFPPSLPFSGSSRWPASTRGLIFSQNRFILVSVLLFVPLSAPHLSASL